MNRGAADGGFRSQLTQIGNSLIDRFRWALILALDV